MAHHSKDFEPDWSRPPQNVDVFAVLEFQIPCVRPETPVLNVSYQKFHSSFSSHNLFPRIFRQNR